MTPSAESAGRSDGIPLPGLPPEAGDRRRDLAVAAGAALEGGRAAMAYYGEARDLRVREKGEDDPVTAADRAANRAILACLRRHRPDDPVLSEESRAPATSAAPARLWVVDPLDGTKEFIAHNGEFTVMVGLAEGGRATLGAVYLPDADRLFLGVVGAGAWTVADAPQDPRMRRLEVRPDAAGTLRFLRSRSHPDPRLRALEEGLGDVEVILSGSAGLKCCRVAEGTADLYVHPVPYLKEWDTCAPEAVLRGAGGRVTDCGGRRLAYGKRRPSQPGGIFAAPTAVWERVAATVREVAADLLEEET